MTKSSGSPVPELSRGEPDKLKHNTDSSPDIHKHRKNSPNSGDLRYRKGVSYQPCHTIGLCQGLISLCDRYIVLSFCFPVASMSYPVENSMCQNTLNFLHYFLFSRYPTQKVLDT